MEKCVECGMNGTVTWKGSTTRLSIANGVMDMLQEQYTKDPFAKGI